MVLGLALFHGSGSEIYNKFTRMDLVIDVGNTRAKAALFERETLMGVNSFAHDQSPAELLSAEINNILYASVVGQDIPVLGKVAFSGRILRLTPRLPLPIENLYGTPETLGPDRLAGACGAVHLFPSLPCLIVDAGTSLTCDFVNRQGQFVGGSISPGINMRFKALHENTSKLPLVGPDGNPEPGGTTTESCIQSGVQYGSLLEIRGFVDFYRVHNSDLQVILTGGDAPFFEKYLKAGIFVAPNLVLIGLNQILQYNVSR